MDGYDPVSGSCVRQGSEVRMGQPVGDRGEAAGDSKLCRTTWSELILTFEAARKH